MYMLSILYSILFMPIEFLVETTFSIMYRLLNNIGLAIIAVSIVVQTIVLPLYKRADAVQEEERSRQSNMEHWIKHIKKSFKGDEKYMMLSAYYKEQDYKPWYAIRSSISIFLQIPFFTAAYHYLSHLDKLKGESFLFINDLSLPDATLSLGGVVINILPIIMTLINMLSGSLYTKGLSVKEKVKSHGLAVIFLVLLYNSPSGLVLYWTMNNVYSLVKNFLTKVVGERWKLSSGRNREDDESKMVRDSVYSYGAYLWTALFLAFFIGGVVLLNVLDSSATEFINTEHGPVFLAINNIAVYFGFFVVWGSIFFALMHTGLRRAFIRICFILSGIVFVDYMFFGRKMGTMSPLFELDGGLSFSASIKLVNILAVLVVAAVMGVFIVKKGNIAVKVVPVLALSAIIMSVVLLFSVNNQTKVYEENMAESRAEAGGKVLQLSSNARNVVVIMLDRAISGFVPYIFSEKPEIAEQYKGFVYYPNTITFGSHTNFGAPGLFGGYEYTPEEMNKREDTSLQDKHNEALLLMPALFSDGGFNVTVCDPPYAGTYKTVNDLSMYSQYKNVQAYNLKGTFLEKFEDVFAASYQEKQESRAFYYCIMKVIPVFMQDKLYNYGEYCTQKEVAVNRTFLESYSTLLCLDECTDIENSDNGGFLLIQNSTTHDPTTLDAPDYEMVAGTRHKVREFSEYYDDLFDDDIELNSLTQIEHYQSNLAALRAVGNWFDYLRENGCWDNTRIIIVSDHGYDLGNFDSMLFSDGLDLEAYNSLLMMKDYNSEEFIVSDEFMTIADVPTMAMDNVIDDPVNPFTGNEVNTNAKQNKQKVTTSLNFSTKTNHGNVFDTSDGEWYEVTPGDVFDEKNWNKVQK